MHFYVVPFHHGCKKKKEKKNLPRNSGFTGIIAAFCADWCGQRECACLTLNGCFWIYLQEGKVCVIITVRKCFKHTTFRGLVDACLSENMHLTAGLSRFVDVTRLNYGFTFNCVSSPFFFVFLPLCTRCASMAGFGCRHCCWFVVTSFLLKKHPPFVCLSLCASLLCRIVWFTSAGFCSGFSVYFSVVLSQDCVGSSSPAWCA